MMHLLLWSVGGVVLCGAMAAVADRLASDLFRPHPGQGRAEP